MVKSPVDVLKGGLMRKHMMGWFIGIRDTSPEIADIKPI